MSAAAQTVGVYAWLVVGTLAQALYGRPFWSPQVSCLREALPLVWSESRAATRQDLVVISSSDFTGVER